MILLTTMNNNFITKKKSTMIMEIKRMKRPSLTGMSKSIHLNRLMMPSFKKGKKFSLNMSVSNNLLSIRNLTHLSKNPPEVVAHSNHSQLVHLEGRKY